MKYQNYFTLLIAAVMLPFIGCAEFSHTTVPPEPICLQNVENSQAMEVAENVLRNMHFVIEKYDTDVGFIRSKPLRGAQFFEFWRSDNVDPASSAQANIHSIQRIAVLNFVTQPEGLCVDCDVAVRRLSIPDKGIVSESYAAGMYTHGDKSLQKLTLSTEQKEKMAWVDLGSDAALETKIIELIQQRIQSGGRD